MRKIITLICIIALAGCGSSPGPSYYVATDPSTVLLIQWGTPENGQAAGTMTYDTISTGGSDPSSPDSLSVQTLPVTVSINGSNVAIMASSLFGSATINGTLGDGTLTITVPPSSSNANIQSGTLSASDPNSYNQAVAALDKTISDDNAQAAQAYQQQQAAQASASAAQAQAQKVASDQQTASSDIQTMQGDASTLSGDVSSIDGDVSTTNSDLQTLKSDAAAGPDPPLCTNVSVTVNDDASVTLNDDQTVTLSDDVNSLQNDISTAQKDISTVQGDLETLASDGVTATPASYGAAISAAQSAVSSTIAKANADIGAVNSDVATGYQIANSIATGACSGMGPGSPPAPEPTI